MPAALALQWPAVRGLQRPLMSICGKCHKQRRTCLVALAATQRLGLTSVRSVGVGLVPASRQGVAIGGPMLRWKKESVTRAWKVLAGTRSCRA